MATTPARLLLAAGDLELPVALGALAEGVTPLHLPVVAVLVDRRLAAFQLPVLEALRGRDLAGEVRLRRLPFSRRAVLALVERLRHERPELLHLVTLEP